MSTPLVIAIVVLIIAIAAVAVFVAQNQRRRGLRERFGPEYERTVAEQGDPRSAERTLQERVDRRKQLDIRELPPESQARYAESWRGIQARFVDDPRTAVREADQLVTAVMRDRGYPTEEFDQQAADVSVDHAGVVSNYRSAHAISVSDAEGRATTDDLRQAMVHYRTLFRELLGESGAEAPRSEGEAREGTVQATRSESEERDGTVRR